MLICAEVFIARVMGLKVPFGVLKTKERSFFYPNIFLYFTFKPPLFIAKLAHALPQLSFLLGCLPTLLLFCFSGA